MVKAVLMVDKIWLRKVARNMARRMVPEDVDLLDGDEVIRRLEDYGYTNFQDVRKSDLEKIITDVIAEGKEFR